jgi:dihydrofolate reductase
MPVFVLTHHPRRGQEMEGGTVVHFVTEGIEAALARAREAVLGLDVRLGGGVATIREYLNARLADHVHIVVAPVFLGGGEPLYAGLDLPTLGYQVTDHVRSEQATHAHVLAYRRDLNLTSATARNVTGLDPVPRLLILGFESAHLGALDSRR